MDQTLIENDGGLMRVQVQRPHPQLRPFVSTFALLQPQQTIPPNTTFATRILPDGSAHLIWHLYQKPDATYARLRFVGPRSVYKDIDRRYRAQTFLTTFRPGYASLFITEPVEAVADMSIGARLLWRGNTSALSEQLYQAEGLRAKAEVMERMLCKQLQRNLRTERWLSALVCERAGTPRAQSVRALADGLGVSERHLRTVLTRAVGLRPKQWLRVERLRKTLCQALSGYTLGWAALAVDTGYYDQAHMIDEFQMLIGETPQQFLQRWMSSK